MESQILNIITIAKTFDQNCKMSALQDDGMIDKDEQKQLQRIHKVTEKFILDLKKIK